MKYLKLKVDKWEFREKLVSELAHTGRKVWVDRIPSRPLDADFFVCFELRQGEVCSLLDTKGDPRADE